MRAIAITIVIMTPVTILVLLAYAAAGIGTIADANGAYLVLLLPYYVTLAWLRQRRPI